MFLAKVTSLVPDAESIRRTAAALEALEISEFSKILKICSNALQWAGLACLPKADFKNKFVVVVNQVCFDEILNQAFFNFSPFFDNFVKVVIFAFFVPD